MSTFSDVLKYLSAFSPLEKGKAFELFCKWFLENDPRYSSQIKTVWLWREWPGNWGKDKGVDLIAQTHSGKIWAIQAKCYDEDYYVTKNDIDKFLSESSRSQVSYRLLISTTDRLGDNAREVIAAQEKQVGICSLEHLLDSSLSWPSSIGELQPSKTRQLKTPRHHQAKAIESVLEGFKTHDKGQLYMACGTGKTLVSLWIAEALKSQHTLVLVPSISLVSQVYQEWVTNTTANFIPIFVCSDPTVGEKDQMVTSLYELGFPTTTDPYAILNYFSSTTGTPKVIFSTYHSSPVIKELCALDKSLTFDITIADEAHRCAGAVNSDFATLLEANGIRTRHKLFMTATPKIFSGHVKAKAQELEYDVLSMDDEEKFGPVFHKLPFSAAISQDLLSDYEVLISIMDDRTYKEYAEKGRFVAVNHHESDARSIASQLLISKAIKSYDLKRIITFHNRKSAADDFISSFPIALNLVSEEQRPRIGFYGMILGDMLQSKRKSILKIFESIEVGSSAVLANVRCLSEGVDVPMLDGVAFIDPKGSEIEIVQAVGRAIRKAPNKKRGLIILPVFIDADDDPEINLEQSCFKPIWKVLNALRAHDDILAEELDHLRLELGRRTYKKPPKLSKITIDLPVSIDSAFSDSLRLRILENTSTSWFYYFGLLQNFKELHKHTNVPSTYKENPTLATWVTFQRVQYKNNNLSKERIKKLEILEFIWDPIEASWEEKFTELKKYKSEHGHCNVPQIHPENKKLSNFVVVQRSRYKSRTGLARERIAKLEDVGFVWDPHSVIWNEMFFQLCEFKEKNGHCIIAKTCLKNPKLSAWVAKQRTLFKDNNLDDERVKRLNQIGFVWHSRESRWQKFYSRLVEFKKKTGHFRTLEEYPEDFQFDSWIRTQRKSYEKETLPDDKIKALEVIGFTWENLKESAWEEMFEALCLYKKLKGDCLVPKKYKGSSELAGWVSNQRQYYRDDELLGDRVSRLESIGFCWDPFDASWKAMFGELLLFKKLKGHCNVRAKEPNYFSLGGWVARQREQHRKKNLSDEQIRALESIGFVWDIKKLRREGL